MPRPTPRPSPTHTPLIRQWRLLEWLSATSKGIRVAQAVKVLGVSDKTIRRDLVLLRRVGFDLREEVVNEAGLKAWRIKKKKTPRSISGLLDALVEGIAEIDDARLLREVQAFRVRVEKRLRR